MTFKMYCDSCEKEMGTSRAEIQFYTKHYSPHWEKISFCENCAKELERLFKLKLVIVDTGGMGL